MSNRSFRIGLVLIPLLAATAAYAEVRVSSQEAMKAVVQKVPPEYSGIAKQMKILGRVEVEASISESGDVDSAKAVSGNPLLTASAITAVKKWKFTPFQENGAPAKAVAILVFEFK